MVLCAFVFLLCQPTVPSPTPQPAEVSSTHWVSLRALLSPSLRAYQTSDASNFLARNNHLARRIFNLSFGQMLFAAIRLVPTESLYCSTAPGFLPSTPPQPSTSTLTSNIRDLFYPKRPQLSTDKPLLLWGLTLDILSDFLELVPPHNAINLWTYPTFSALDVKWMIWLFTYTLRKRRRMPSPPGEVHGPHAVDDKGLGVSVPEAEPEAQEVRISELGVGRFDNARVRANGSKSKNVGAMMDRYLFLLQRAVFVSMLLRAGLSVAVVIWLWRKGLRSML